MNIDFKTLKDIFIDVVKQQERFQTLKRIDEFKIDEKYVGDMFNYTIFEDRGTEAPIFYQINSPFDIYSKRSPQQALVFSDGKLTKNIDYTEYAKARTGLFDALFLEKLFTPQDLQTKHILMIGSGGIARYTLQSLSQLLNIQNLSYTNQSQPNEEFESVAKESAIKSTYIPKDTLTLDQWDIIIMHTSASSPVLTKEMKEQLKPGTVLMTYSDSMEIDSSFYDPQFANLIVDYEPNIALAKDVSEAIKNNLCTPENFAHLLEHIKTDKQLGLDPRKYTLFRSKGTPYQNVAMLKYLDR